MEFEFEERPGIEYLKKVLSLEIDREAIFEFQKEILSEIRITEKKLDKLNRKHQDEREKVKKEIWQSEKGSSERYEFNDKLDEINNQYKKRKFFQNRKLHILRLCMDHIVWELLDRFFIRNSYQNEERGFITFNEGHQYEVELLDIIYENFEDHLPILNDITNVLQLGDITKIDSMGKPMIMEVKSTAGSKKELKNRELKQFKKYKNFSKYFKEGEVEIPLDKVNDSRIFKKISQKDLQKRNQILRTSFIMQIDYEYDWNHLRNILNSLEKKEVSFEFVDGCMFYIGMKEKNYNPEKILLVLEKEDLIPKESNLMIGCLSRAVEEMPYVLPVTQFEIEESKILDIVYEECVIMKIIIIDELIKNLKEKLKEKDIEVRYDYNNKIFYLNNSNFDEEILMTQDYLLDRVMYEFLSLDSFLEYFSMFIDKAVNNLEK